MAVTNFGDGPDLVLILSRKIPSRLPERYDLINKIEKELEKHRGRSLPAIDIDARWAVEINHGLGLNIYDIVES